MSEPTKQAVSGRDEETSALFAQMVVQQANLAMMLLGKVANPQTGETVKDIDSARLFIDQLEMLEIKTKGNLTRDENAFLKQSLMSLRMAFVEAVNERDQEAKSPAKQTAEAAPPTQPGQSGKPPEAAEEHHKKFSKKY